MSKPTLAPLIDGCQLTWAEERIRAEITGVSRGRSGGVLAEVWLTTTNHTGPGDTGHLDRFQLNLLASRTKRLLAKDLAERYPVMDWILALEQLTEAVLAWHRQGEPLVTITALDKMEPPSWLIHPLLPWGVPTIIDADGGMGKSLLAEALATLLQWPLTENNLGLGLPRDLIPTLWLDYEATPDDARWRLIGLGQGLDIPTAQIEYRPCARPLVDDLPQIQRHVEHVKGHYKTDHVFLVVDSLTMACAGKLVDDEPARDIMRSLRLLKGTSPLVIAHNPKTGTKTVYGNVAFRNLARSVWHLDSHKTTQEPNTLYIRLRNDKVNRSGLFPDRFLTFSFAPVSHAISVRITAQTDIPIPFLSAGQKGVSLQEDILTALEDGPLSVPDLALRTGEPDDTIRVALSRLKAAGRADNPTRGQWLTTGA